MTEPAHPDRVDLRTAARALLAGEAGIPLAIHRPALDRIVAIARADSPVYAAGPELQAASNADASVTGGVAVVPLQGVITPQGSWLSVLFGGSPGGLQGFRADLRKALDSNDVHAIVLDVHSPGGSIGLVPETAAEVRAARGDKPIIAVANTMTASAAYWIAAQADELVITPSGFAGSIGVYLVHEDWSGFNEQAGIAPTYIYAGKYKVEGNADEPLGDVARAALQQEVDDLYAMFVEDVAAGRGATTEAVRNGYGEGRVLPAQRALAEQLGDRVATADDVIREASQAGPGGAGARQASGAARKMRAQSDNPAPNATQVAEEVRARIAELSNRSPIV